eukprot:COSAG03_NODE_271_length_9583_cov_8.272986_1_plen_126_part_00
MSVVARQSVAQKALAQAMTRAVISEDYAALKRHVDADAGPCLPACLSVRPSACLSVCMLACLPVWMSVSLSLSLSLCLCLSVSLSLALSEVCRCSARPRALRGFGLDAVDPGCMVRPTRHAQAAG